jgi:hypothetical protein
MAPRAYVSGLQGRVSGVRRQPFEPDRDYIDRQIDREIDRYR